ncbi:response regulator [Pseudobutyrivibrio sp.]|uniref:response regulator n=1 Tax=Pseudobutyrivibrio sp. TaxID=2014367 RepID=UPI001B4D5950|nr:response regulator [Pseudobutyrivibrio sp.]MBP3262798.1 response regulator [Pseudobutyrivibrio sp.]
MKRANSRKIMSMVIGGSIIVLMILVFGTIWTGSSASKDTEKAVRNVSLLYLEELAGRREQVVASTLNDYISDLDVAIGLLTPDDLSNVEKLQAYQLRMKQLYGLEKFAFVDEDGVIYTSMGTRTDIEEYDFDYAALTEPEISLKNAKGENTKVVIVNPTDRLPYQGHFLVACFMEIDMESMLENISLQSGSNNTTFCNLYTTDGYSLTNTVLGGLASEDNLLVALNNAKFENDYNVETVKDDFGKGNTGVVSFTYNNIKETMYYVPVHRTDWMLTYLIRESVISGQIDTISEGIIIRSLAMAIVITFVLTAVFITLFLQTKKTTKLAMERETSELMQQELEERIALQDELLEQEKKRARLDKMVNALASDYRSVYYVNLDKNTATCFRNDAEDDVGKGDEFVFSDAFIEYAKNYVAEDYKAQFLEFIKPENIRTALKNNDIIAFRYMKIKNGVESYEMLRMADVKGIGVEESEEINAVGVGFTDIDVEMRESLAKNQALSDALKTAEAASKAKTTFLSSMSHEIRTPMNAIIGLDTLALNEPDISDTTKDYLEKIGSSAQHLLSLINDILDMSRIESGRMSLKNEEFAFSKVLEQINVIFSGQCQEKGLEYNCRIKGHLNDYYIGDSVKLRQVLINILGNAVKFTPKGGKVELIVEKISGFDGRAALQFKISDTGIGMSKEYIPRLFDSFSQEDAGATNKYGSSGLGMAITKSIVEMMNGEISVESEKNVGTTFTVNITLKESDRIHVEDKDSLDISVQDLKVLVVDDDPLACNQAKLVMSQAGIIAETSTSGQEAIELVKLAEARQDPYNLIIVDWQMPEMDGVETTKQIRSVIGKDTAVIILTAYNWDDIYDEAKEAGVDSFISKPLFTENLINEFKDVLEKKNRTLSGGNNSVSLEGKKVLLAEDVAINAQIMMKVLSMKKLEVDHAVNGKEVLNYYESKPEGYYDVMLMDIRMPEMDGLTATKHIRTAGRADSATIPIIALTANAFDEDVQQSLQAGMNAHLSKPVEPQLLFETLEKLLRG